ncbi:hypothetical protein [Bacillus pumilus]|uniref:Uncharacterized protein n=1 Tax=Bacillus pumilus TaxID=1408 RepID=A0A2G8IQ26_BACPU|nr:hypothetical protein [Bacillus pumilus]PIK25597.1 hypothetical protein CTV99_17095 [Bacillus pumilus]
MFFRKMTKREQINAKKAAVPAFIFYILALGGHALYSFIQEDRPPVTFVILMAGLFVYFMADWLFNKIHSYKKEALITRASFLF